MRACKSLWMLLTLEVVVASLRSLHYEFRGQNSPVATGNKGPDFVSFPQAAANIVARSEERRVGKECRDRRVPSLFTNHNAEEKRVKKETLTDTTPEMQSTEISHAATPGTTT